MVITQHPEKLKDSTTPNNLIQNNKIVRQQSRDGSHHTSIKGEPGSAPESNASARASVQGKSYALHLQTKETSMKQNHGYSSSQSLYSFLHSSDDNDLTDCAAVSSRSPKDVTPADCKVFSPEPISKPVMPEQFCNENIYLKESRIKSYQLEEQEINDTLRKDREKLLQMQQSNLVEEQLKV